MLDIEQQHAGGIGVVGAVDTGQPVVDVVLRQHDLLDAGEVLRLVVAQPEQLGRGEAGKRDVGGVTAQLILADLVVQVIDLLLGAAVIPQDAGADDLVGLIQHDKAVHLAACADAPDQRGIEAPQQRGDTVTDSVPPIGRLLLAPAGVGERDTVLTADNVVDPAGLVHQQQLDGGGAQINADVIHSGCSFLETEFLFKTILPVTPLHWQERVYKIIDISLDFASKRSAYNADLRGRALGPAGVSLLPA